jgi:Ca2+/H+ antiporter, TMEM165/GDT1 family
MGSLLAALGLVFLAELGDKTQLVAMGLGARHRLLPVIAGVALAYAATNLLSVAVGGVLGAALPTRAIGIGGGILFLGFALWGLRTPEEDDDDVDVRRGRVVLSVAAAVFLAELGDKTMLATITLATDYGWFGTWIGSTLGMVAADALAIVVGRALGRRLPEKAIAYGAAALFFLFGIWLGVEAVAQLT